MRRSDKRKERRIASERVDILMRMALEKASQDLVLAKRYAETARKIRLRSRVQFPLEYKRYICRHCNSLIVPGVNCRVRTQPRREPHLVVTCFECGKKMRMPLGRRRARSLPDRG